MGQRLIIDLDGTIAEISDAPYSERVPMLDVIARMRAYKEDGFTIVIHTARNMRTHKGVLGLINVHTVPTILEWLRRHDVPYDELVVGKPWCDEDGFYVDDKAVRPDEFARLTRAELDKLVGR